MLEMLSFGLNETFFNEKKKPFLSLKKSFYIRPPPHNNKIKSNNETLSLSRDFYPFRFKC